MHIIKRLTYWCLGIYISYESMHMIDYSSVCFTCYLGNLIMGISYFKYFPMEYFHFKNVLVYILPYYYRRLTTFYGEIYSLQHLLFCWFIGPYRHYLTSCNISVDAWYIVCLLWLMIWLRLTISFGCDYNKVDTQWQYIFIFLNVWFIISKQFEDWTCLLL